MWSSGGMTGKQRILRNEEHNNLYSSACDIRGMKSGTVGWVEHAAHVRT
jgi:hypothetical protein